MYWEVKSAVEWFSFHFTGVLKNSKVHIALINVQSSQLYPKKCSRNHMLKNLQDKPQSLSCDKPLVHMLFEDMVNFKWATVLRKTIAKHVLI